MTATLARTCRWAVGDGGIYADNGQYLSDGNLAKTCADLGTFEVAFGKDAYRIERVSARYCTTAELLQYAKYNGDDFERLERNLTTDALNGYLQNAIQAAEETIESCTGRSFCTRKLTTKVDAGFNELPVVDATDATYGTLLSDRQLECEYDGETTITYGRAPDANLNRVALKLAASYVRPRVGSENTRGTSMDGVYVSYNLATGEEPNWTGIPEVDAFIQQHRVRRPFVG